FSKTFSVSVTLPPPVIAARKRVISKELHPTTRSVRAGPGHAHEEYNPAPLRFWREKAGEPSDEGPIKRSTMPAEIGLLQIATTDCARKGLKYLSTSIH